MFRRVISVFLMAALVSACAMNKTERSDMVEQPQILQTYWIGYDEEGDKTQVMAQLRTGGFFGPTLRLVGKSSVRHDVIALTEEEDSGTRYKGQAIGWARSHTFRFTDTEGKVYANTIENREIGFPRPLAEPSRSADWTLIWTGDRLQDDESVFVTLTDSEGRQVQGESQTKGLGSVTVKAADLATLKKGAVTAKLTRGSYVKALSQATEAGGFALAIYETKPLALRLND